jgi:hypothetical protein
MVLGIPRRAEHRAAFEHYVKASSYPFGTGGRDPRSNMTLNPRQQIIRLGHEHCIAGGERDSRRI